MTLGFWAGLAMGLGIWWAVEAIEDRVRAAAAPREEP